MNLNQTKTYGCVSYGTIWIRINDPRALGSRYSKETDESTLPCMPCLRVASEELGMNQELGKLGLKYYLDQIRLNNL